MQRWVGKVAVVTGGSTGIGQAICVGLADAGLKVIAFVLKPDVAKDIKGGVKGRGSICMRECDVTKPKEVADAFSWVEKNYCGVDVLVNNAGVLHGGQITDVGPNVLTEAQISNTINTNVIGLVMCTRRAVTSMRKRKFDGHIFNISSVTGHYVPTTNTFNVYPCTKHAVTAFTGSLNNELAQFKSKIKSTAISPGLTTTPLADGLIQQLSLPVLHPRDIAAGVVWALSSPPHVNITEITINAVEQVSL